MFDTLMSICVLAARLSALRRGRPHNSKHRLEINHVIWLNISPLETGAVYFSGQGRCSSKRDRTAFWTINATPELWRHVGLSTHARAT